MHQKLTHRLLVCYELLSVRRDADIRSLASISVYLIPGYLNHGAVETCLRIHHETDEITVNIVITVYKTYIITGCLAYS